VGQEDDGQAEIKKILEKSFAHVHEVISSLPDADLDKTVTFFGHDMSVRSVLIILVGHMNEHLGKKLPMLAQQDVRLGARTKRCRWKRRSSRVWSRRAKLGAEPREKAWKPSEGFHFNA